MVERVPQGSKLVSFMLFWGTLLQEIIIIIIIIIIIMKLGRYSLYTVVSFNRPGDPSFSVKPHQQFHPIKPDTARYITGCGQYSGSSWAPS